MGQASCCSTVWSWPIISVGGKYEAADDNYLKEAIFGLWGERMTQTLEYTLSFASSLWERRGER
jgi:hypothetical protein